MTAGVPIGVWPNGLWDAFAGPPATGRKLRAGSRPLPT